MRDDFPKQTITEIAKGVGYRCSNPECRRPTVGANAAQDGIITIGVAAHICAASAGGPRYNQVQTRDARRSKENGIWLCQNCGRLVDADPQKFTVESLFGWKRDAQERAFRELVAPGVTAPTEEAARIGSIIATDNASGADPDFSKLFAKVHAAATTDLAAYRRGPLWMRASVELTLRLDGDEDTPPFSISRMPLAVEVAPEVTIIAPPGTGKTTTLLQLAGHVLDAGSSVPLYFRLGDWSAGSLGLLASLHERAAFKAIHEGDLRRLAEHGRLLLLLDGWNELDPGMRKKLRVEIEQIRHDWPYVRIVATTRRQMLDVPISGPRLEIEPLSEEQQMAIAHAQSGAAGETVVDDAWRTAGVRELIATPLYLTALLSGGSEDASPSTKEQVLRLFVKQHERASDHAEALQAALFGCHADVLTALARHLNTTGSTTMTEANARRIVNTTATRLREHGQMTAALEPLLVLEVLTSHHILMRAGNGGIAFQHQQFQEWYASGEVAEMMRETAKGDAGARVRLRTAVLDQPAWEESIFFAAERVSREDGGAEVVAHAVRLALPIDPMLAAEMIYRATPATWEIIRAEIIAFVDRWHRPGTVDRAVRFMIMTGRPEFASRVWPLASCSDSQIQLPTLRIAPRFRPAVLGPDLRSRIAGLAEETREHLLALIASESGVDGMDLATELAKADPSPKVQAEVVQYLQFRRASRHAAELLAAAHEETWALIAARGYAEEIRDPATVARLRAERKKTLARATKPEERLRLLLEQTPEDPDRDGSIAAAIADPRFPVDDQQDDSLHYAQQHAPAAVLQGLRQRLETGLELPFHSRDLLDQLGTTDEGPIAEAILDTSRENRDIDAAAIMAGPKTVAALIEKYLDSAEALRVARNDRAIYDEYDRIKSRIRATRPACFVAAIIGRAETDDPRVIASLASLISQHGDQDDDRKQPLAVDSANKPAWLSILRRWVEVVITSPSGNRYQLNEVSNAIGRSGFSELIPEMKRLLDEELARHKKARDGYLGARRRGDIDATSDAAMFYDNQYQASFSRIGGDEVAAVAAQYLEDRMFGFSAALILKAISDNQQGLPEPSFNRRWPWFEDVKAARALRAAPPGREPENKLAAPIFAAIDRLAKPETDKDGQLLAIRLARIGLAMPHTNQDGLIARVMALPQSLTAKRELLAAIVLDGQVLDAAVIMQAIDEWLADAGDPKHEWHKKQNTWEIEPWLELLPFTTRAEAVLEGLTKVKAFYGSGWAKSWERVLAAVAAVPEEKGETLLASLARTHKDIARDHEWMRAILGRDSRAAVLLYVDLVIEGALGRGRDGPGDWHLGQQLAEYIKKYPDLKAELKTRYESVGAGPGRSMLEHFFGAVGSDDDLIAMIRKYIANGQAYDGRMAHAVEAVAVRKVPISDDSNAYNLHPASVSHLRKFLFDLLDGTPTESALAKRCLIAIDRHRDEHGIAANDARHPDVMSERPWPPEAGLP